MAFDPHAESLSWIFHGLDDEASRHACLSWVRDVSQAIGYEPPQGFGDSYSSFTHLPADRLERVLALFRNRPSTARILQAAGPTWLAVLMAPGVLPDGAHRTARSIRALANDGCACLSLSKALAAATSQSSARRAW